MCGLVGGYSTACRETDVTGMPFENSPQFRGAISFDNVAMAFLTLYQVISNEGWTEVLYLVPQLTVKS